MPDIKHLLTIEAPAGKVHKAMATVEGLSNWWTSQTSGEAAIGNKLRFGFGPGYYKEMKILAITADTVKWECTHAVDEWVGTSVLFYLEEVEEGNCVLHFEHSKWADYSRMFSRCSFDWAMFLRSLKMYCETGRGLPYPNQGNVNN